MLTTISPPHGRGCGSRSEGAPYACCGLSKDGLPIESFIVDPAIPWPGKFQRGVKILPRNPKEPAGINDLIIFVGQKFYPAAWDFIAESKLYGASRRLPANLPFEKLTPGESRMIFVHSRAIPDFDYEANRDLPYYGCQHFWDEYKQRDITAWQTAVPGWHLKPKTPCTFALRDLAYLIHAAPSAGPNNPLEFKINVASTQYTGLTPVYPLFAPQKWQVGIFLALPLTHIEFCRQADPKAQKNAIEAGFSTEIMEY